MLAYLAQGLDKPMKNKPTMKNKIILAAAMMMTAFVAMAQVQPVGHLTIFSEAGDKFYLILNGERQNNVAQTNLRVEDLTNQYYTAKIIFEDKALPEIEKKMLMIADADGIMSDVTYKIKKNANNGKLTLNYFSSLPVQQGFKAPSNVHVVHYGTPDVVVVQPAATTTTVTQTTTTTTGGTTGVNATVNMPGVNMNVNITDPTLNSSYTTTVTETSTTNVQHTGHSQPASNFGCSSRYCMSAGDFSSALATVKGQSFEESKLKTAQQIASSNCLNASQVSDICRVFGFEQTKLDFAKFAYDRCTEPNNYFKVNNVFSFSSSSDELNEYIATKK